MHSDISERLLTHQAWKPKGVYEPAVLLRHYYAIVYKLNRDRVQPKVVIIDIFWTNILHFSWFLWQKIRKSIFLC